MSRYGYNERMPIDGLTIVKETDDYIKYKPSEGFKLEDMSSVSIEFTNKDLSSRNFNYLYSKTIRRMEEIYNSDVSSFVDENFKSFVKQDMKRLIKSVPKKYYKNDKFTVQFNIENLLKRIIEFYNLNGNI